MNVILRLLNAVDFVVVVVVVSAVFVALLVVNGYIIVSFGQYVLM